MFELIKDINSYLSNPFLTRIPDQVERPFLLLFRLTLICVFASLTALMLLTLLIQYRLIPEPGPHAINRSNLSKPMFLFRAVLLAPLLEELIFRAQLRRFSGGIFFISFIIGAFLSLVFKTYWTFLVSPVIFILLFIIYRFTLASSITKKYQFWRGIFPWYFHVTALCFALIHLSNFEKGISLLPLGLLYTLPQLCTGLVLGYARMNYGLKYSIALHALFNLLPTLLLFTK